MSTRDAIVRSPGDPQSLCPTTACVEEMPSQACKIRRAVKGEYLSR